MIRQLSIFLLVLALPALLTAADTTPSAPWWDAKWPARKQIVIDTSERGVLITEPIGTVPVLLRLHDGNFNFMAAKEDGSDLRFVAQDGKTVLKHHIEKWDSLLNEAYVWVQLPELNSKTSSTFWLYYGNVLDASSTADSKATYDAATTAVFHFADAGSAGKDSTASGLSLEGTTPPGAGLAAGGQRLFGQVAITLPDSPSLAWAAGSSVTWSAWIKPTASQPDAVLFSRREGTNAYLIGINNGVPFVEINKQRSGEGAPVSPAVWHHLAVVTTGGNTALYVDGSYYSQLTAGLPGIKGPALIGKDSTGTGFAGDIDELQIASTARSPGWIKFAATSQGTGSDVQKLVNVGNDEASSAEKPGLIAEHIHLITDISKDLTPDGWIVIGLCTILAVVGWGIAIAKFFYLNKISKATAVFLQRWEKLSADLTAIDHGDADSVKTLGGAAGGKAQKLMRHSPLYHIYHLGSEEIRIRQENAKQKFDGLSGRSIQAIKATLHGGLVREVQRLNSKLVFLTIGIAGGPYLGLLGTVIGVMITFAVIAKSGQVEVNSIAPGIAGALLATVAGLAVAIPALFAYSYLSSRIKDAVSDMETFIDEFIAKMAEHYPEGRKD